MLVLSILFLIGTSINNKIVNSVDLNFKYREENGKTVLELEEKEVVLQFGKESVRVVNSHVRENKETQLQTVLFIRKYLGEQTPRQTTDLLGEFRLHNALYRLGIKRQQAGESDLDYIKDIMNSQKRDFEAIENYDFLIFDDVDRMVESVR